MATPDPKPLLEYDDPADCRQVGVLPRKERKAAFNALHRFDDFIHELVPDPSGAGYKVAWRPRFTGEPPDCVVKQIAKECWREHCPTGRLSAAARDRLFAEFEQRIADFERRVVHENRLKPVITW